MTKAETPVAQIWQSISAGDVDRTEELLSAHPSQVNAYIPFGGGTFLHLAASKQGPDMLSTLLDAGFELNTANVVNSETALCCACSYGNYDAVKYLLERGAILDVSHPDCNPLFAAIIGTSLRVVKLLLDEHIDASIRYTGGSMNEMDAVAFALERGEGEIAACIASSLASGEAGMTERLLARGMEVARLNNGPR